MDQPDGDLQAHRHPAPLFSTKEPERLPVCAFAKPLSQVEATLREMNASFRPGEEMKASHLATVTKLQCSAPTFLGVLTSTPVAKAIGRMLVIAAFRQLLRVSEDAPPLTSAGRFQNRAPTHPNARSGSSRRYQGPRASAGAA